MKQLPRGASAAPRDARRGRDAVERACRWATDFVLAALVCGMPLLLGGRHPWGRLVLVAAAVALGLLLAARRLVRPVPLRVSGAALGLVGAVGMLIAVQCVRLPAELLTAVSPGHTARLPAEGTDEPLLGAPPNVALVPESARDGMTLYLAYALLFFAACDHLSDPAAVRRMLRAVAVAAVVVAGLGLAQHFAGNGKFLWFYEPALGGPRHVQGPFTNRNHFAHFLALGLGALAWWVYEAAAPPRRPDHTAPGWGPRWSVSLYCRGSALAVVAFAALVSLSRGGMLAMAAAAGGFLLVVLPRSRRPGWLLGGTLAIGLLLVVMLQMYGQGSVADRLASLTAPEGDAASDSRLQRRQLWTALLKGIAEFPWLGTGVGSHVEVWPMYLPESSSEEFTHAENGYLQWTLETGLVGLALLAGGLVLVASWCVRRVRACPAGPAAVPLAAVCAALAASLVHAAFDFVWYVPACMVVVVLMAAAAWGLSCAAVRGEVVGWPVPPWAASAAAALVVLAGTVALHRQWQQVGAAPHWEAYLRAAKAEPPEGAPRLESLETQRLALEQVLRYVPRHSRAHLRLARVHLALFELRQREGRVPMPLGQIADAAAQAGFSSPQALHDWLVRATGGNVRHLLAARRHARLSLEECRLHGAAYLYLSQMSFLDGPRAVAPAQWIARARRVRPFDGPVLFAAGLHALRRQEVAEAQSLWRQALRVPGEHQLMLMEALAGVLGAEEILEQFEPPLDALHTLARCYQQRDDQRSRRVVLARTAEVARHMAARLSGGAAARLYHQAGSSWYELGQMEAAAECYLAALQLQPGRQATHEALGRTYFRLGRWGEAAAQFEAALRFEPGNQALRNLLEQAHHNRLRGAEPPPSMARRPAAL